MQYEGNIIRPPSEANSIILQVTTGCSYNKCTFCAVYKDKSFRIRTGSLKADIDFASKYCQRQRRVFLADGDALIIPHKKLVNILKLINNKLPWVNRVSAYANCKAIRSKSSNELLELKKLGMDRLYLGLESGHDSVLKYVCKGETAKSMIDAALKVKASGLFLSVTVLLGLAGNQMSHQHAEATGKVLSLMQPNQIAALTLMPLPQTKLYDEMVCGDFTLPDSVTILQELRTLVQNISLDRVQFFANHASNYLHLSGRLKKDKEVFLKRIDDALNGDIPLVQENWRTL